MRNPSPTYASHTYARSAPAPLRPLSHLVLKPPARMETAQTNKKIRFCLQSADRVGSSGLGGVCGVCAGISHVAQKKEGGLRRATQLLKARSVGTLSLHPSYARTWRASQVLGKTRQIMTPPLVVVSCYLLPQHMVHNLVVFGFVALVASLAGGFPRSDIQLRLVHVPVDLSSRTHEPPFLLCALAAPVSISFLFLLGVERGTRDLLDSRPAQTVIISIHSPVPSAVACLVLGGCSQLTEMLVTRWTNAPENW